MDNAQVESLIHHSQLMELMDKSSCDSTLDESVKYNI